MKYNNDERYWNINLLNKWFAISSILFLIAYLWMFYHDNDDEFKAYQKEFRKLEIEVAEKKLVEAISATEDKRNEFEDKYNLALIDFNAYKDDIDSLNTLLEDLKGKYYKANMDFLFHKAEVDGLKYLYEEEIVHHSHYDDYHDKNEISTKSHDFIHKKNYEDALVILKELKVNKENYEISIAKTESLVKSYGANLKVEKDALDKYLREVSLLNTNLEKLDRQKMTIFNQIGDIVRDLPILDFMQPYYKVNQVVLDDIKYDVNFASVPSVDRCTSCHLGISNPDFKDAPQPYTAHPDLDLFVSSSSPHPFEEYGCTSCHSGRGRGTDFISSVHIPNSKEQEEEWIEKYDWYKLPLWLQPMLPVKYTQSSCFKCHDSQPFLEGGEKLALGLKLIDQSGCNNCHHIETYQADGKSGPPLTHIDEKLDKEWVTKWIKNPQSFRYNTWMPHFFGQENNSSEEMVKRTDTEIHAITEYLFSGKEKVFNNSEKYLGDAENGERLFKSVGCMGCHVIEPNTVDINVADLELPYELSTSDYGYEPDTSGSGYEKVDRYSLLKYNGPNLIGLGSKSDAEWIYNWIKNPEKYWPDTKMPNLRLSDEEARDITSYLLTFKNEEFEEITFPDLDTVELENIARRWMLKSFPEAEVNNKMNSMSDNDMLSYVANKSINYYGCYTCHEIDGFENGKPIGAELTHQGSKDVHKLDFGHIHFINHSNYSWYEQKLANPRIFDRDKIVAPEDKSRMPNFYFKPEEIEAITTAILGFSNNKVSENKITYNLVEDKSVFEGYKLIVDNNCQGCHIIDGFGGQIADFIGAPEYSPPNLNTQGQKTQPDWLFKFFKHPSIIRPNLQVRMPSFNKFTDQEWNSIINAFQWMENHNLSFESDYVVDKNTLKFKAGKKLHEFGACNNCHFYGEVFPTQGPQTWAPNLALSKERLRPDWIVRWLDDPSAIMPGTKMPAPYIPDSIALGLDNAMSTWGKDIMEIGADRQKLLEGLTDYMLSIPGNTDIDYLIKEYFKENGYDFDSEEEDDDFDEDEEW